MKLVTLVPTYSKTKEEIINLYHFLNIKGDALFINQCKKVGEELYKIDNSTIKIISSNTIGVSKNRNNLLNNSFGDICICIDDDCPLIDNYELVVMDFFKKYPNAEFIIFNGVWSTHNNRLVHNKKTKRVKHFNQISYAGGPGFVFKKEALLKYNLKYDESVGTPNYICYGEDSFFYHDLIKSKAIIYRSSDVLFNVAIDEDNSSYFKGINKQYINTRGYCTKKLHPHLFNIYKWKHVIRFKHRGCTYNILKILKYMDEGAKMYKEKLKYEQD